MKMNALDSEKESIGRKENTDLYELVLLPRRSEPVPKKVAG